MRRAHFNPLLVVAVILAATWKAWVWYAGRVSASPEEALALGLTLAVICALALGRRHHRPASLPLAPISALLVCYATASALAPPIFATAFAALAALFALYVMLLGLRPPPAFYGLVALSLPVLPSLQFVLGYPLRVVSATLTVAALKVQGLAVSREGTHLIWAGERIQFDAPCSGVNMLWAGLMLTLTACTVWRSGMLMTVLALAASLVLTILANVLRATSLFYVEAGCTPSAQPWWHEAIGMAAFMAAAALIIVMLSRLRAWEAASWTR